MQEIYKLNNSFVSLKRPTIHSRPPCNHDSDYWYP